MSKIITSPSYDSASAQIEALEEKDKSREDMIKSLEEDGLPEKLIPAARYRYVITKKLNYAPPKESLGKAGSILLPGSIAETRLKNFMQQIMEIVSIGPNVAKTKDREGNLVGADLKVGQWVSLTQASSFTVCGQPLYSCTPEFISTIIKQPEEDMDEILLKVLSE